MKKLIIFLLAVIVAVTVKGQCVIDGTTRLPTKLGPITTCSLTYTGGGTGLVKMTSGLTTGVPAVAGTDYPDFITDSIGIKSNLPISFDYNSSATVSAGGLGTQQGIGFDGTNTYLTYTAKIEKRDGSLILLTSNASPYTSITGTVNHLGDGEVSGSYLYVPVENYSNCTVTNIRIVKYLISDLSFDSQSGDLSASVDEASGLTILADTIYISSFCTPTTIKKFNKNTFAFIGAITIVYPETPASGVQGICNDGTRLYVGVNNSDLYSVPVSGGVASLVYSMGYASEIEGTDYYSSQIRWLLRTIDNNSEILKLDKQSAGLQLFSATENGTTNVRDHSVARALKVGYQPELSFTFNPALSIYSGYWTKILLSAPTITNKTSIGHDHTGTSIFCNGYYDGGSWQTFDNTKVNLLYFQNLSSLRHEWRYAPAGTPVWQTPFYINTNPTLGADLLTATTETYNIGSSSSRILNAHIKNGVFSTVVNIGGASSLNGTILNTTSSTTNPQVSIENTGTGGARFYIFSTNNSNGSGGGKFLIAPTSSSGTNVFCMTSAGRIGINGTTTPTAYLHLSAGLASASGAALKYTTGALNTTAEAGANEYNNSYYQTKNSGLRYALGGTIFDAFADAGNSTTTETDLHTYTTPASTLSENGGKITAVYGGTFVSSATATRQMKVYFGGTAIFDSGALTISATASWDIKVTVIRVSSTVVRYSVVMSTQNAALASYVSIGELTGLTLTNTNIIKVTGQAAGVGAATNDIVLKLATGDWKAVAAN